MSSFAVNFASVASRVATLPRSLSHGSHRLRACRALPSSSVGGSHLRNLKTRASTAEGGEGAPAPGLQRQRRSGGILPLTSRSTSMLPFGSIEDQLARTLGVMDEMMGSFFGHPDVVGRLPSGMYRFKCDVMEKKNSYIVHADLPGVSKDQIGVKVSDDRVLHVTAERKERHEEEADEDDFKFHAYERTYGKFERLFPLPDNADADAIKAEMKDGVLTVTIDKIPQDDKEEAAPERAIPIAG